MFQPRKMRAPSQHSNKSYPVFISLRLEHNELRKRSLENAKANSKLKVVICKI